MERKRRQGNILENLCIVILVFYPLRHINWGLDLWDTGYNYANFQYMGTEHMDSMWLFSTYLSNVTGNFLMRLPSAGNLVGMNFYTGLTVSLLALIGYFFCTRRLKMPEWVAFIGELAAISLCWCPTALLYNYLTYVFFLGCVVLLYRGLTEGRTILLVLAGACLGANVLVRFSNLPEAALILAVWAYDIAVWRGERNERPAGQEEGLWRRLGQHTFWCLAGYGSSLLVLLGYIHVKYGFGNYVAGILRLFAMTDTATDYKADSMLFGMINEYVQNLYWVIRIGVILAAGVIFFALAGILLQKYGKMKEVLWWWLGRLLLASAGGVTSVWLYNKGISALGRTADPLARFDFLSHPGILLLAALGAGMVLWALAGRLLQKRLGREKSFRWECRFLWAAVSAAMLVWLYAKGFCVTEFLRDGPISYGPILRPGILFLMLTILIGLIRFADKNSTPQEKLVSAMVILVVLLTSLGSNNKLYPSMNNLFLAAPYTLWQSWRFFRNVRGLRIKRFMISAFPAKGLLAAFLLMCLFQFGGFGAKFVFAEATGVYNLTAAVENNGVLKNIKMSPEKARWMTELSDYVGQRGLQGREVILYGNIPSLSYYLQMPPAFNSWSDLRSYSYDTMLGDLEETETQMVQGGGERPVVLVDYLREGLEEDEKWKLIWGFMERNGYELTWSNDRFAFYE